MRYIEPAGTFYRAICSARAISSPASSSRRLNAAGWTRTLRQASVFRGCRERGGRTQPVRAWPKTFPGFARTRWLGADRRVEHRSTSRKMHLHTPFTPVGVFVLLTVFGFPAFSQIDRSAYGYSTIEQIVAKHGLRVGAAAIAERDTVLIRPEYKYRLLVKATGRIRDLTPDAAAALSAWGQTNPDLPAFLKEYTHEVEVMAEDKPVWLIWQRSLVAPFRAERSSAGQIEVYVILAGAFHGKLLLLATAFESLR